VFDVDNFDELIKEKTVLKRDGTFIPFCVCEQPGPVRDGYCGRSFLFSGSIMIFSGFTSIVVGLANYTGDVQSMVCAAGGGAVIAGIITCIFGCMCLKSYDRSTAVSKKVRERWLGPKDIRDMLMAEQLRLIRIARNEQIPSPDGKKDEDIPDLYLLLFRGKRVPDLNPAPYLIRDTTPTVEGVSTANRFADSILDTLRRFSEQNIFVTQKVYLVRIGNCFTVMQSDEVFPEIPMNRVVRPGMVLSGPRSFATTTTTTTTPSGNVEKSPLLYV